MWDQHRLGGHSPPVCHGLFLYHGKTLAIRGPFCSWAIKKKNIESEPIPFWFAALSLKQYQHDVMLCFLKVLENLKLLLSTWKHCVTVYLKVKISKGPWIIIYLPCHYSQLPGHRKHSINFLSSAVWWWIWEEFLLEKKWPQIYFLNFEALAFFYWKRCN